MNARALTSCAAFLMALLSGAPQASRAQHTGHAPSLQPGADITRFAVEMKSGMDRMMRDMHAPGYTGNPDADFLAMMIPHHEGAVEMARLVLVHGRDSATRRLADEIIASQTVEIEAMKKRLAFLRGEAGVEREDFPALGGTRGPPR